MEPSFNGLTPAEDERLSLLMEECGEVIQVIGKIMRHGYLSRDPTHAGAPSNLMLLHKELGDLDSAVRMMVAAHDINRNTVSDFAEHKRLSVQRWLHHQEEPTDAKA